MDYLIGLKAKWVSKVYRGIMQTKKKKIICQSTTSV